MRVFFISTKINIIIIIIIIVVVVVVVVVAAAPFFKPFVHSQSNNKNKRSIKVPVCVHVCV